MKNWRTIQTNWFGLSLNKNYMETSTARKIKIGIFTIAGILLFVAGIFIIGNKKNMFSDTFTIYGNFRNVGGLAVGNNIRFAGITVGTVEGMSIVSDTIVRVDMRMKADVKQFLKADSRATIGSDGLMGDKLITILPGSASEQKLLADGSQIATQDPIDFDKIIAKFTNVADNAEIITSELAGMAIQIRTGKGSLNSLLYSDVLSKSLEGTAANAQKVTSSLAGIADHVKSGQGSIGSLLYTDALSNRIESVAGNADKAVVQINKAAYEFTENMKALHGNFFFKGYFKRKAEEAGENPDINEVKFDPSGTASDMDSTELVDIIAEAQKALDAKRKRGQ
jgi:phospholipid/cholesterol/gamma-HCH transport system substrate-binding protein